MNPVSSLSPAEYLAIDRASEFRHEYADGHMYAKSGGTSTHSFLIASVAAELKLALRGRGCPVSVTLLRLQIANGDAYFYPDAMVFSERPPYGKGQEDIVVNPTVIVEVLSDSTERWERTGKFAHYRRIPSLREYVLVSQNEPSVEWFTLREHGNWIYRQATGLEAQFQLDSLGIAISLEQLYRGIELSPTPAATPA